MKSGFVTAAPCWPPHDSSRSRATLPYASSLKSTITALIFSRTAVESSCELYMNPPSPVMHTTVRSGRATFTPSEVGTSKPRLPEYDDVRYVRGRYTGQNG